MDMIQFFVPRFPAGTFERAVQANLNASAKMLEEEGEFILLDVDRELDIPTPLPTSDEDEQGPAAKKAKH